MILPSVQWIADECYDELTYLRELTKDDYLQDQDDYYEIVFLDLLKRSEDIKKYLRKYPEEEIKFMADLDLVDTLVKMSRKYRREDYESEEEFKIAEIYRNGLQLEILDRMQEGRPNTITSPSLIRGR